MTVVRPNSISGITSITAQTDTINFFKSDGTLQGLLLNGTNFNTTSGVSTFNALNVGVGGTVITATASGLIGIGITNPGTSLHLGSGGNIRLNRNDNTRSSLIFHDNGGFNINANSTGDDVTINAGNAGGRVFLKNNSSTTLVAASGVVLIGTETSTGTVSQSLQVTGGAHVSGNVGIGTTTPTSILTVTGDARVSGVVTATSFVGSGANLTGLPAGFSELDTMLFG